MQLAYTNYSLDGAEVEGALCLLNLGSQATFVIEYNVMKKKGIDK